MEFENCSSVNASTRCRTPVAISASTWAFTFSTPASAKTTAAVSDRVAAPTCVEQHGYAVPGRERLGDAPRQDPSREIVDHGVQIGAGPIQQANDGRVDVPHLVGSSGSKPDLGFRGVHAESGPSPAVS